MDDEEQRSVPEPDGEPPPFMEEPPAGEAAPAEDASHGGPEPEAAPASVEPAVRVEVDVAEGDFTVRGGAPRVLLTGYRERREDDGDEHRHDVLRFSRLPDDCTLAVPDGAEVLVRRIYGDLEAEAFNGLLMVQHVNGDAELDGVAVCDLMHVGGDLEAYRGIRVRARHVDGDVTVRDYREAPVLGHIGGDLDGTDLPGLGLRDSVGGDVSLERCGEVVLIGTIGGDVRAERSVVTLRASAVGGDVHISTLSAATVASVGGDVHIERAAGAVDISSVGGEVTVRGARGPVRLNTIGGDVVVEDALGGLVLGHIGGDAELETALAAGATYELRASGDVTLRVRGDVNARFVAQTFGGEIRTRLPLTVERGRRRNLVGVLGRGDATVTLRSDGGDILIATTDRHEEEQTMADDFAGGNPGDEQENENTRTWEASLGGRRFRVRWDRGPGRANVRFQGPFGDDEDPDAMGSTPRDFNFGWERGRGPKMSGEYEERLNELREKAERVARRAAEQAQDYADRATKRARETDWEAVGREVRTTIERAMADLEDAFTRLRRDWEGRRPGGPTSSESKPTGPQRVRIEYEDEAAAGATAGKEAGSYFGGASADDVEAQRRAILEELRNGTIGVEEAERRLNELR
jgi:hypothetical protein